MSTSADLGARGEALAAATLVRAGMRLLERNWRAGHREIDLIAEDGEVVVFVEVKTRSRRSFGGPLAAVTRRKQRHLTVAARLFLAQRGWSNRACRFDVVAVVVEHGKIDVQHVRGAFDATA
jgi:putative endonuclease